MLHVTLLMQMVLTFTLNYLSISMHLLVLNEIQLFNELYACLVGVQ